MVAQQEHGSNWVLLSYRIPREPSTPRIAIWRRLNQLGVAKIGDGLVALPSDARTKEHLEWIAAQVIEADGEAIVWTASPTTGKDNITLARQMSGARTVEYERMLDEIQNATRPVDRRTIARWRREWRRIDRRDYFRSAGRDAARLAINDMAGNDAPTGETAGNDVTRTAL